MNKNIVKPKSLHTNGLFYNINGSTVNYSDFTSDRIAFWVFIQNIWS